jgi:hypothetical protein
MVRLAVSRSDASPGLRDAFADSQEGPAFAQSVKLRADLRYFLRRIRCPLLGRYSRKHAAGRLSHFQGPCAKTRVVRVAEPVPPADEGRPLRSHRVRSVRGHQMPAFARQLSVLSGCFARVWPVRNGAKAPGVAAGCKLSEYASLDAQCTLDDEVLEIMRHEGIVSWRRIHFDDPPACQRRSYGILALVGAKKRDRHRSATGCCHSGTAASLFRSP